MRLLKRTGVICLTLILCIITYTGCVKRDGQRSERKTTAEAETEADNVRYNTEDTVVVTDINTEKFQISVQSTEGDRKIYILNYNSGTSIKNKYGTEVLISRIEVGEIVEVYYVAGTQKLIAMKESGEAWENNSVTNWDMDYDRMIMSIGTDNYKYDENIFIKSGKKTIDIKNISSVDTLVVRGIGSQIYSITVKNGHGYIRLTDTINMVGGIVEVGKIMTVITEDMVIVAPEGEYTLTASKNGKGGSVAVKVERDDEVTVSLSGFEGEIEKNGAVKFNVLPEEAAVNVFIDGEEVDITEAVDLSYGVHKLTITSDTYTDYTEEFTVSSIYMNKTVDISASGETESTSDSDSDSDTDTESETKENEENSEEANNQVTINKPEGASVYLDGIFKGTVPLTITKESGSHTLILRKTGYESVVYNVEFSDDESNVSLSFPELEESQQ